MTFADFIAADFIAVDWTTFALAFAVILVAAVVQGAAGLGFGVVAAPVMAIIDPVLVPGPLLVLALFLSLLVAWRERTAIRYGELAAALAGRIPASFLAGLTVGLLPTEHFLLVFSLMILAAVALSLSGWRLAATRGNLIAAGAVSGYMGTITSVGAPPMGIIYQHVPGPHMRATMAAFFVVGAFISLVALAAFDAFGWKDLLLSLKLVPAMVIGFAISGFMVRIVDKGYARTAVLAVCTASAGVLLVKALW
ncbi:MAG: TSUP family transporter [Alphaproteobacteria bacterium]